MTKKQATGLALRAGVVRDGPADHDLIADVSMHCAAKVDDRLTDVE
jgi:hypothetical protein